MPGQNLTRDEARERASSVAAHSYTVELDLTTEDRTFRSTTVVQFAGLSVGGSTFIDLIAPAVLDVTLNGRELDPADVFDGTRIALPDLAAENTLRVVADCAYMHTGEGLHRFIDPVDKGTYLYTQFEVADAKRVFACFDQPDLKATFAAHRHSRPTTGSSSPTADARPRARCRTGPATAAWAFDATPPVSTYITALVAGSYEVVRSEYRRGDVVIPMAVACRRSLAAHLDADEIFAVTRQGFDFFLDAVRLPVPVRQVRPALRARVQRRGDGERRRA